MLTRFFGTAKPLAIALVMVYMTVVFFFSNKEWVIKPFSWWSTLQLIGMWLLFILAMFILNFITQKNDLTQRNTYGVLLFGAFSLALPAALRDGHILLAGAFLLIATRRIISFKSELHMERKIFDATFWILLATLSFYLSWLYIFTIYLALLFYSITNVRYFIIPLIALISFSILYYCFILYQAGDMASVVFNFSSISFDFSAYGHLEVLIAIAFFIGVLIWTIWAYLAEQNKAPIKSKGRFSVVLGLLLVGLVLVTLTASKTGGEWYFLVPAMTIILTNYLEHTESLLFKESLLWLILILPILIHLVA